MTDSLQSARIQWLACVMVAKTEPSEASYAALKRAEWAYVNVHANLQHLRFLADCASREQVRPRFRKMPKGANLYPVGNAYKAA